MVYDGRKEKSGVAADRIGQRLGGPYKYTCFEKGSIRMAEGLSQEKQMWWSEGLKGVEVMVVVVVVVVVVQNFLVQNCVVKNTNGGGEGSLERDVAAANERPQNRDRD